MNPAWTPPTLDTDRLQLRAVTDADADAVFAACSNPNVTRFTLFETNQSVDDALGFVRHYARQSYAEQVPDPFAVTLKDDPSGSMVGAVGCHWYNRSHFVMELGYWIAEPFWGRGIATEAGRAAVGYVFDHFPHVRRVQARVIVGNPASARVLDKIGFQFEGTHRAAIFRRGQFEDVAMFAVLRTEWL